VVDHTARRYTPYARRRAVEQHRARGPHAVTVAWLKGNIPERDHPAVATVGIAIAKKWKCGE